MNKMQKKISRRAKDLFIINDEATWKNCKDAAKQDLEEEKAISESYNPDNFV